MQHKSDKVLESKLDKNLYQEEDLLELKLPINLPYQTTWAAYERFDGEIEIDGILYKYVERKVSDDTLYLKCLPNKEKMNLENAKDDFFRNTNGIAQNKNTKSGPSKTAVFKKILGDFEDNLMAYKIGYISPDELAYLTFDYSELLSFPHNTPGQPPELDSNS